MMTFAKERLREVVAVLAADATVWVPAADGERITFVPWRPTVEPDLAANADRGPKMALFPATEKIFRYSLQGRAATVTPWTAAERAVLFGVRSCDTAAIGLFDKILLDGGWTDACYEGRRRQSVVIALGCTAPGVNCFCASLGINPAESAEADVQMYDLGGGFGLAARTEAGRAVEAALMDAGLLQDMPEAKPPAYKKDYALMPDIAGLDGKLRDMYDDALWEEVSSICLGCGACTYVCPTCHCFNMVDAKTAASEGYKLRTWDSCQWGEFTRMAGGHNPRPGKKERVRQRFMHKLCYGPEKYGRPLCTGCGRCRAVCPVSMDITRVIARVKEAATNG